MKRVIAILLTLVLLLSTVAFATTYVQFKRNATGYKKAGTGKTNTVVRKGSTSHVSGKVGKTWTKVVLDSSHALWFQTKYLRKISEDEDIYGLTYSSGGQGLGTGSASAPQSYKTSYKHVLATGKCNIRQTPGLDSKKLGTFKKGKKLTYLGKRARDNRGIYWYKVRTAKGNAWVSSVYSKVVK